MLESRSKSSHLGRRVIEHFVSSNVHFSGSMTITSLSMNFENKVQKLANLRDVATSNSALILLPLEDPNMSGMYSCNSLKTIPATWILSSVVASFVSPSTPYISNSSSNNFCCDKYKIADYQHVCCYQSGPSNHHQCQYCEHLHVCMQIDNW